MASKLKLTELLYPTSTTAAITINSDDSVTIPTQSTTNLAYTGTLTGGTGVVNLGSGQFYKDASGNVGIGTSSPGGKLDVFTSAAANVALFRAGAGQNCFVSVVGNGNTFLSTSFDLVQDTSNLATVVNRANGALAFGTNNSEAMRIISGGNVGIGTASPLAKLQVYPTVGAPASSGSLNTGVIFAEGAGGPSLNMGNFNSGGTYYAWIQSAFVNNAAVVQPLVLQQIGGNVGIGTTLPQAKIDLGVGTGRKLNIYNDTSNAISGFGTDLSGSGYELSCFAGGNGVGLGVFTWLGYNRTTDSYSERMRLDASGNLLVGTTSSDSTTTGVKALSTGRLFVVGSSDAIFYRKSAVDPVIQFRSDNSSTNRLVATVESTGTYNTISDRSVKKNIEKLTETLPQLMQILPVKFNWISDSDDSDKTIGFVAQDVENVYPQLITERDGQKMLNTTGFIPFLVKAIQEQQALIQNLTTRLNTLEGN
jgi:hypothetical protein